MLVVNERVTYHFSLKTQSCLGDPTLLNSSVSPTSSLRATNSSPVLHKYLTIVLFHFFWDLNYMHFLSCFEYIELTFQAYIVDLVKNERETKNVRKRQIDGSLGWNSPIFNFYKSFFKASVALYHYSYVKLVHGLKCIKVISPGYFNQTSMCFIYKVSVTFLGFKFPFV